LILYITEAAVLEKGFSATSIDEVIAEAGLTKSGFFYHFPDKNTLACALLMRYLKHDTEMQDEIFDRARELVSDPLHAFLAGLKMLAELLEDLPNGHPGCIVATLCYQDRLFDGTVRDLNRRGVLSWRKRFRGWLDEISEVHAPRPGINLDDMADMVSAVADGGLVLGRALGEPKLVAQQIMLYRRFVELAFEPEPVAARAPMRAANA
jgi:TetR/AcrR family transcriptional repressor of nem operon